MNIRFSASPEIIAENQFFEQIGEKDGPWLPRGGLEIRPEASDTAGFFWRVFLALLCRDLDLDPENF